MERVRAALADRSIVLLIDNCEHLLPGIAELVAGLLGSNPGVRVLATSREPLQVAGEQVWPLDPLDVPPPSSSPEQIRASASGVLFISRLPVNVATQVSSVEDVAAVGVICRNLEGLPLGARARRGAQPHVVVARPRRPPRPLDQRAGAGPVTACCPVIARCGPPSTGAIELLSPAAQTGAPGDECVRRWLRPGGLHRRVCR